MSDEEVATSGNPSPATSGNHAHASRDEPSPFPDTASSPPPARGWLDRKRAARLVALAGVLALVLVARSLVLPNVAAEHDVVLQLEAPRDVIGIDIRWSAAGSDDDLASTSLYFSEGKAPRSVPAAVRLPDGTYDVTITVRHAPHAAATDERDGSERWRRRITLGEASRVTIPLR